MFQTRQRFAAAAVLATVLAAPAWSARAEEPKYTPMGKGLDITTICGDKPATVALVDGVGGNSWRRTVLAELKDEAAKCPNITKVSYAEAEGDQQKFNASINSFVAQGTDILLAFPDFGDASLPAFRAATQAGVVVVPYFTKLGGTPGIDYTSNVYQAQEVAPAAWADWLGKNLKSGNVVYLGGPAGTASSQLFFEGLKEGLKKYPDFKLLGDGYVVTNWNAADAQKAVAGLIARYPEIDAVASDYGISTLAAVKTFKQAGLPIPAFTIGTANNELNCKYLEDRAAGKGWQFLSLDGLTTIVRFALRRGLAEFEGTQNDEGLALVSSPSVDSAAGLDPICDPTMPPDADFSSLLDRDALRAALR